MLTTGYVEAVAGMSDGEFQLLLKPFSLEALADALGAELTQDAGRPRIEDVHLHSK